MIIIRQKDRKQIIYMFEEIDQRLKNKYKNRHHIRLNEQSNQEDQQHNGKDNGIILRKYRFPEKNKNSRYIHSDLGDDRNGLYPVNSGTKATIIRNADGPVILHSTNIHKHDM